MTDGTVVKAQATHAGAQQLTFDVVIATRNRPEALALSIPLLLEQSRQPDQLIVIDSSENHETVARVVAETTKGWAGTVIVEHSKPGLPHQRNLGLAHVTADIVFFPDDDSLLYPGASEAIMTAYERDVEGCVAAVCAAEALVPPSGAAIDQGYQMSSEHRRKARFRLLRNRAERKLSQLNPGLYLGNVFKLRRQAPDWLEIENCVGVEYMTGFRMSFRVGCIKAVGFDDTLQDYALNEDVEASFAVARDGLLIGALNAQIYHHRFPGGRGNGYTLGAISVLNQAYVVLKHAVDGQIGKKQNKAVRRRLKTFIRLKILVALLGVGSGYGRERLRGTLAAAGPALRLIRVPRSELVVAYRAALDKLST